MRIIFMIIGLVIGFWGGVVDTRAELSDLLITQQKLLLELELDLVKAEEVYLSSVHLPLSNLIEEVEDLKLQRSDMFIEVPISGRESIAFGMGGDIAEPSLLVSYGVLHDIEINEEGLPQ